MNPPISKAEKWLIEREFIAREKEKHDRRKFRNRVFGIGIIAGILASALSLVFGGFFIPLLPKITWITCLLIYLDVDCLFPALSKQISPSWHANPWKESLSRVADPKDVLRGIALLACFKLSKLLFLFIIYLMK